MLRAGLARGAKEYGKVSGPILESALIGVAGILQEYDAPFVGRELGREAVGQALRGAAGGIWR